MNLKRFLVFGVIVVSAVFFFGSCKEKSVKDVSVITSYERPELSVSENDLETSSGRALLLQLNTMLDTLDVMFENGMQIPSEGGSSRGLSEDGNIDFSDLINFIPKNRTDSENENFNKQIQKIGDNFTESLNKLIPDGSDAVDAGLLLIDEENNAIVVSDDEFIPVDSIQGIMTIEIANMMADGMTAESAIEKIQSDVNKIVTEVDSSDNSRGLYIDPAFFKQVGIGHATKWPNGKIKYMYADNDLSAKAKTAIREAMDDWQTKTDNAIEFTEVDYNVWNWLGYYTMLGNVLKITGDDLEGDVLGNSNFVGYNSYSHVRFDEKEWEQKFKNGIYIDDYKSVPRHELGHVLGLYHEHQRPDRDKYIIVDDENKTDEVNFGILKAGLTEGWLEITWDYYDLRIWFITIRIWYPVFRWRTKYVDYVKTSGEFDFRSVMLYTGFDLVNSEQYKESQLVKDKVIYPYYDYIFSHQYMCMTLQGKEVSYLDAKAVKSIYQ